MKTCSKCDEEKSLGDFNKQKLGKFGRRSYCRACQSIMSTAYHKTPRGKANRIKNKRKYDKTEKGRAAKKVLDAKYYIANKDAAKFRARQYEEHIKRATPPWTDIKSLKLIYKNRPEGYHVDHIIPLRGRYVCGLNIPENLQYLEARENLSKGNRHESDR